MTALLGIGGFALRNWKLLATGIALAVLGIMLASAKADARHWEKRFLSERKRSAQLAAAHEQTVTNYRTAADLAKRQAEANVARVKSEQSKITEEVSRDYQARLADARARYERLRSGTPATNPGGPGATDLPRVPGSASGPDEAAGQDGLPPADALICTEQAIQLEELQAWVRRQSAVNNSEANR